MTDRSRGSLLGRGCKIPSQLVQAVEEIEGLKRSLSDLLRRLEALEHRVGGLETPKA